MTASPVASSAPSPLLRPIESLDGVGPTRAKAFKPLGVSTLGDLLEYFPRDYQFESAELPIARLVPDQIQMARGEVVAVDYVPARGRPRFEATIKDGTGTLALVWFNASYMRREVHCGNHIRVQGKVGFFRGLPQMVNPKFTRVDESTPTVEQSKFKPVYPASLRLASDFIARVIEDNLDAMTSEVQEWFDASLLRARGLLPRRDAYRLIHRPADIK